MEFAEEQANCVQSDNSACRLSAGSGSADLANQRGPPAKRMPAEARWDEYSDNWHADDAHSGAGRTSLDRVRLLPAAVEKAAVVTDRHGHSEPWLLGECLKPDKDRWDLQEEADFCEVDLTGEYFDDAEYCEWDVTDGNADAWGEESTEDVVQELQREQQRVRLLQNSLQEQLEQLRPDDQGLKPGGSSNQSIGSKRSWSSKTAHSPMLARIEEGWEACCIDDDVK
eukprot:46219-Amphidinium_carterae.1